MIILQDFSVTGVSHAVLDRLSTHEKENVRSLHRPVV